MKQLRLPQNFSRQLVKRLVLHSSSFRGKERTVFFCQNSGRILLTFCDFSILNISKSLPSYYFKHWSLHKEFNYQHEWARCWRSQYPVSQQRSWNKKRLAENIERKLVRAYFFIPSPFSESRVKISSKTQEKTFLTFWNFCIIYFEIFTLPLLQILESLKN